MLCHSSNVLMCFYHKRKKTGSNNTLVYYWSTVGSQYRVSNDFGNVENLEILVNVSMDAESQGKPRRGLISRNLFYNIELLTKCLLSFKALQTATYVRIPGKLQPATGPAVADDEA